jgi:hypothetical protein
LQVAMVIVEWNHSDKKYDSRTRNCQHFIDDLFKRGLGINPSWAPAIGNLFSLSISFYFRHSELP